MVSIYKVIVVCKTKHYLYQVIINLEKPPLDPFTLKSDLTHIYNHPRLFSKAIYKGLGVLAHANTQIIVDAILPYKDDQKSFVFDAIVNKELPRIDQQTCENILFAIVKSWKKLSQTKRMGSNVNFNHATMQWRYIGRHTTRDACRMCHRKDDSKVSNTITDLSCKLKVLHF